MEKYFKKFSVMFVVSLIFILGCCGSAFATDTSSWNIYDDDNIAFTYENMIQWSNGDTKDFLNGGVHYTKNQVQKSSVKFNFTGTQFVLKVQCYSSGRNNDIDIYIDGEKYNFSAPQKEVDGHVEYYTSPILDLKEHTVSIQKDAPYSDGLIVFDEIDINGELESYKESIILDNSSINLTEGNSQQLIATTTPASVGMTWKSSDESIATVDSTGKVTAVKEGQATITATMADGSNLSSSCTVNVTNPITPGITLNKTSDSLITGQTDNLVATTTPSAAQVTWTSSDVNIATVDSTGKITAIKAGTVTITASTPDGVTASATVTVANATGGNVTPTNPTDNSGGTSNIVNIAYAKGENTNNAGGEVSIIFNGLPDTTLSVVKTADVKSVYVGDTFTYTIVATNTGAKTAKSVVISDSAPNHIQFMPSGITTTQGTVDPSSTSSNILVNVGDIPPLGTVTIKIPATVVM